ncbi:MAG: glycerol-3-phosphate dehydrogenase/oxidase [Chitinophagales bacterium]|nr:glycerol-3-phosphate dehydrogenase/oxidase [Chitinophagales bacterium]
MNRQQLTEQLKSTPEFDICIIGGGATGLGIAVDAASRGYKTALFEQLDFAKGTSSRSTKLVHGGVRYLQQGNIKLVMEALKERGLLLKNAPALVSNQKFIVPNYKWWEKPYYGIGLKIYDWMAGSLGIGPSELLSKEETLALAPTLDPEDLTGAVLYHDGQFDDARLAISLAKTAVSLDAVVLNYFPVTALLKKQNNVCGVQVKNSLTGKEYSVSSKVVINATGVFTDRILSMDNPAHEALISPSQGIHLVVDKEFLPGDTAIMIPKTDDGRVLFAVPWHDKIVLGTTDTPVDTVEEEPRPLPDEIDFILTHIGRYLTKDPQRSDVKSMFAGLRPLVKGKSKITATLSRDHLITISESDLITVTGGKWTTYRKMAEDAVNLVAEKLQSQITCVTHELKLKPLKPVPAEISQLEETQIKELIRYCAEQEMCQTVEDFLSRRTRQLLLDTRKAIALAPLVAGTLAELLQKEDVWVQAQINNFKELAKNYLPDTQ